MKSLETLKKEIKSERRYIGKLPYSHNIISLKLCTIANRFGDEKANEVIRELGLEKLGWKQRETT